MSLEQRQPVRSPAQQPWAVRWVALLALALSVAAGEASAQRDAGASSTPAPVLVELFTSQGCSSCPPADRLLEELGREGVDGPVVALAYHVDYWNELGWPDPFASPVWSDRQRAYATALGLDTIYTPQLVVNGVDHVVGSDREAVERRVRRRRDDAGAVPPAVSARATGDTLLVRIDAVAPQGRSVELMLAVYENGLTTQVPRGENARRTLSNHHVVRELRRAGSLEGSERLTRRVDLPIDPTWQKSNLGVAVFLQDPVTREVVTAQAAPVDGYSATTGASCCGP